jgi:gliding motility-associated-like protein
MIIYQKKYSISSLIGLILIVLFMPQVSLAQNETSIWYFGNTAGINFNTFPPGTLSNGLVNTQGGSACMSDSNGDLLFYTDGTKIFNKNHAVMANSWGLLGHPSSTQNSLIIKQPGNPNLYYVFTNGAYTDNNGLCYSIVDLSLNGGLGDVTNVKNVPLLGLTTEKLSGVKHGNQSDFWVMTLARNSNQYYAWQLSSGGIGAPVISTIGTSHSGINSNSDVAIGQMKFSPDGTRLAVATSANGNTFEIFQFNNISGLLSSPITINGINYTYPYGIEFSADGTLLYCSVSNPNFRVYQFNLQAGSTSAIVNSAQLVAESSSTNIGSLQLAIDGKIYLARYNSFFVGVFNNPNAQGLASAYVDNGVDLGIYRSRRGLPNFVTSWFNNPRFIYENTCYGDTTFFYVSDLNGVSSVLWNFGDPGSGIFNTSTQFAPYHIFSDYGSFQVKLVRYFGTHSDTVVQQVTIHPLPEINLGPPELKICPGESTLLNAGSGYTAYTWMNGAEVPSLLASAAGTYAVTVTDDLGCENSDSLVLSFLNPPSVNIGSDKEICEGSSVNLYASAEDATYLWSNGAVTQQINATATGIYSVTVTNACGESIDSMSLYVYPTLMIDLGADIDICTGDTASIDGGTQDVNYLWSTGSTATQIQVNQEGFYSVTLSYPGINCPTAIDTVQVSVLDNPVISAGNDTLVCEGQIVLLNASGDYITDYLWSTGATSSSISAVQAGEYIVTGINICSTATDTVLVALQPAPVVTVSSDTTIFDDETVQLMATYNSAYTYAWTPPQFLSDPSSSQPIADPPSSTVFLLTITDSLGCTNQYAISIEVEIRPLPDIIIHNVFSPNQDGINETFVIENIHRYENSLLQVFNRDGLKVYEQSNYQNDWDGRYKNEPLPAHVYFFILYPGEEGKEPVKSTVTIIR